MKLAQFRQLGNPFKSLLALALILGLAACGGGAADEIRNEISAKLAAKTFMTGEQENPPVVTGAIGSGDFEMDTSTRVVTGSLKVDGITATAAHIHTGAVGVNGPIIVPLAQTAPDTWSVPPGTTLTEAQAAQFAAGELYFNAHTVANPNGEIRGQIGRDVFISRMTPTQEVPPTSSTASGVGRMILDPATRKFTATITVTGTAANAAHIHSGLPGSNGSIVFPFTQSAPGSNVWVSAPDATLSVADLVKLRAGGFYFNAHSAAFPNGEIRGQIALEVGVAHLTGAEEVPPTPSVATGTATLVIDQLTRASIGSLRVSGITANAAHVHVGPRGVNGPIIMPLSNPAGDLWAAEATLSADNYKAYKQGNLYFNAHSVQFPNGEIRGQIR